MAATIGEHFRDERISAGIGLSQLAKEIGISTHELRKIELGEAEPLGWLYVKLSDRLCMTAKPRLLKDNGEF